MRAGRTSLRAAYLYPIVDIKRLGMALTGRIIRPAFSDFQGRARATTRPIFKSCSRGTPLPRADQIAIPSTYNITIHAAIHATIHHVEHLH